MLVGSYSLTITYVQQICVCTAQFNDLLETRMLVHQLSYVLLKLSNLHTLWVSVGVFLNHDLTAKTSLFEIASMTVKILYRKKNKSFSLQKFVIISLLAINKNKLTQY